MRVCCVNELLECKYIFKTFWKSGESGVPFIAIFPQGHKPRVFFSCEGPIYGSNRHV